MLQYPDTCDRLRPTCYPCRASSEAVRKSMERMFRRQCPRARRKTSDRCLLSSSSRIGRCRPSQDTMTAARKRTGGGLRPRFEFSYAFSPHLPAGASCHDRTEARPDPPPEQVWSGGRGGLRAKQKHAALHTRVTEFRGVRRVKHKLQVVESGKERNRLELEGMRGK